MLSSLVKMGSGSKKKGEKKGGPAYSQTSGVIGQQTTLVNTLEKILNNYQSAQVLPEQLQNADDARATEFKVRRFFIEHVRPICPNPTLPVIL
mgnify:CR=1 FL=1